MITRLQLAVHGFLKDETGATMVEYALILALIAVACITAVTTLGTAVSTEFGLLTPNI